MLQAVAGKQIQLSVATGGLVRAVTHAGWWITGPPKWQHRTMPIAPLPNMPFGLLCIAWSIDQNTLVLTKVHATLAVKLTKFEPLLVSCQACSGLIPAARFRL